MKMLNLLIKKIKMSSIDWLGILFPITIVFVWHLFSKGEASYKVPSINIIWDGLVDFAFGSNNKSSYSSQLIVHLLASIKRVGIGFSIAAVIGIPLGFLTGRIKKLQRLIDPTINALKAVPGIGWLPIAIVWFGVGEKNTLFLMSLASFFPIYLNTQIGAKQVSPILVRAARMLGAKNVKLFTTVIFPAAFPSVVVGLRIGLGVSWAYLVLGEMTGVNMGIGAVMSDSRMLGHVDRIIICMIIIAILGKLTDWILLKICTKFYHLEGDE